MQVIGAGFHRTGTLSLKAALDRLGFGPCYHMSELFRQPKHLSLWQQAADGDLSKLDEVLSGYSAAVDWPACYFWEHLAKVHPRSRIILTIRDPESWFASHMTLFGSAARKPLRLIEQILLKESIGAGPEDRERCIEAFERHNAHVQAVLPPERLLVFEVREGWGPLCDFLGVPAPKDEPFPHLNEGTSVIPSARRPGRERSQAV